MNEALEKKLDNQIRIEFGVTPEYCIDILEIKCYCWSFLRTTCFELFLKTYPKSNTLPLTLAIVSVKLDDLFDLGNLSKIYQKFAAIPSKIQEDLYDAYSEFFYFPNYNEIFDYFNTSIDKYRYLSQVDVKHSNFLTSYFKEALSAKSTVTSFERLEKALGVLWTEEMIDFKNEPMSANKKDFFYMPLSLSLHQESSEFYKLIKRSVQPSIYNEDDMYKGRSNSFEPKKKEDIPGGKSRVVEKSTFDEGRDAVNIYKYNTRSESLINAPRDLFKSLFENHALKH